MFLLITDIFMSLKENHFQGLLFQKEMIFFIDHEYLSIFLKENHFFFLKKKLVCFNFSLIMDIFISLKEDHFQGLLFQEETIYIFF